MYLENILSGQ
jgi:hypothetical protein